MRPKAKKGDGVGQYLKLDSDIGAPLPEQNNTNENMTDYFLNSQMKFFVKILIPGFEPLPLLNINEWFY